MKSLLSMLTCLPGLTAGTHLVLLLFRTMILSRSLPINCTWYSPGPDCLFYSVLLPLGTSCVKYIFTIHNVMFLAGSWYLYITHLHPFSHLLSFPFLLSFPLLIAFSFEKILFPTSFSKFFLLFIYNFVLRQPVI